MLLALAWLTVALPLLAQEAELAEEQAEPAAAADDVDAADEADDADAADDAAAAATPETSEDEAEASGPMDLYVGVYPLDIGDLDMASGTASVTYYIWTRWQGVHDGTAYELVNGTIEAREHEFRERNEEGIEYAYYRCRATVHLEADYHDFPFDEHLVDLELEHSDEGNDGVRFVIDRESIAHVHSPTVSGWIVDEPVFEVRDHEYRTNWGYPGSPADESTTFSQLRVSMRMRHAVAATFAKTFLTLLISVLITFLAFFMHPEELEARVGVGVAGIFGAVTSQAVVSGNLPDIPYLTLSDQIHMAGLVFIFASLLESCFVGWLVRRERIALAQRVDVACRFIMMPAYMLAVALMVGLR